MSILIERYDHDRRYRIEPNFSVADITSANVDVVKNIVMTAFAKAEDNIERQLYQHGFMMCNGNLCNIAEMKNVGNYLVKEYIQELEDKYKEEPKC